MSSRNRDEYKLESPIEHLTRFCEASKIADRHKYPKNYYILSNLSGSSSSFISNSSSGQSDILVGSNGPYMGRVYYGESAKGNAWY